MGITNSELQKKLSTFKKAIHKKYGIQHMILFGSRARGNPTKDSDVDLILVSPQFKNKKISIRPLLYKEWHLRQRVGLPVDFLCYTPQEFNDLKDKISIVSQAIKEGFEV